MASRGKEFLHQIHEALDAFEQAVGRRERNVVARIFKGTTSVSLQQDVDTARQRVVDTIIEVMKEAEEEYLRKQ